MSQFCIDLKDVMLPDAIAALVEAWYEAQNIEPIADWVEELRLQIKREFGRGWTIRSVNATKLNPNGKCQLTRIAPDRTRTSVTIPIEWRESNAKIIKSHIFEIIDLYNGTNGNLQSCLHTLEALGRFGPVAINAI